MTILHIAIGQNKMGQDNYKGMVYRCITIICYCSINWALCLFLTGWFCPPNIFISMICIVIAQYFMFLLLSSAAASALISATTSKYQQETEDDVTFDLINEFIFMRCSILIKHCGLAKPLFICKSFSRGPTCAHFIDLRDMSNYTGGQC